MSGVRVPHRPLTCCTFLLGATSCVFLLIASTTRHPLRVVVAYEWATFCHRLFVVLVENLRVVFGGENVVVTDLSIDYVRWERLA